MDLSLMDSAPPAGADSNDCGKVVNGALTVRAAPKRSQSCHLQ
jgi:hypothetical protein